MLMRRDEYIMDAESIILDDFETIKLTNENPIDKSPRMSFAPDRLYFTKACHKALGYTPAIKILVNRSKRSVLVSPCPSQDAEAVQWMTEKKTNNGCRTDFACQELASSLYRDWSWDKDYRYRSNGRLVEVQGMPMMLFDFQNPIVEHKTESGFYNRMKQSEPKNKEVKPIV